MSHVISMMFFSYLFTLAFFPQKTEHFYHILGAHQFFLLWDKVSSSYCESKYILIMYKCCCFEEKKFFGTWCVMFLGLTKINNTKRSQSSNLIGKMPVGILRLFHSTVHIRFILSQSLVKFQHVCIQKNQNKYNMKIY